MRIEDLLIHREWLRRLARRLVADPQTADDVVQETWLAALRRPPVRLRRARAWLATVLKNAIRDRGRSEATRRRRQERASRPDGLPGTAELVERAELHRHLASLVLGLPEPFRTTVLLRFDEGLDTTEIARRAGVPTSTVRGRLQRGLALLRERLDREQGGDRKRWMTALLPLAGIATARAAAASGAVAAGGLIVGTKVKLALVAAVVLILAGAASQVAFESAGPDAPPEARAANAELAEAPAPRETEEPAVVDEPSEMPYTGRVLDSRRFPRAGVPVVLRVDMAIQSRTVSGEDGRFALPFQGWPRGTWTVIEARDPDDRCLRAIARARMHPHVPRERRIGDLVLRRGHPLEIVVESAGQGVPDARVDLFSQDMVNRGHIESVTTDATGRVRLEGLPPERLRVAVQAADLAARSRLVGLPWIEEGPLRIEMRPARTLEVEVVAAPDMRPVAGVAVSVLHSWHGPTGGTATHHHPPLSVEPTDATGRTHIANLGRDPRLCLRVAARGFATADGSVAVTRDPRTKRPRLNYAPIPPDRDRMRIVLPVARQVEWPVAGGEVPVPPDGTLVAWAGSPRRLPRVWYGVEGARMEGGRLVVDGLIPASSLRATVETPDGALAHISIDRKSTVGRTVVFARPRTLVVVGRRDDGSPATDVYVQLVHRGGWKLGPGARTDATGIARLEGQVAAKAEIHVQQWKDLKIGHADLTAGDARVEVIVPWRGNLPGPDRPLTLRITLSGKKGLPASYTIYAEHFRVEEEDPEGGLIRGTWSPRPGKSRVKVQVHAADHVSVAREVDVETKEIALDLQPAGRLLYRILREPEQRVWDQLLRWNGKEWIVASWMVERSRPVEGPIPGDAYLKTRLPPGRYRVWDKTTGATSEEIYLCAGGPVAILTLDARPPGRIEGFVVGPEGADLGGAFLEVTRADGKTDEIRVGDDARFAVPLKHDGEEVLLTVRHPLLRPEPETGHARVRGSRDGLGLAMVAGGVATVSLVVDEGTGPVLRPGGIARVLLLRDAGDRAPAARLPAVVTAEREGRWRLRFTDYEPGTWTIWFDLSQRHAPLVLEDVTLGMSDADLGTVRVTRGSAFRAHLRKDVNAKVALMFEFVALDGPPLRRSGLVEGTALDIPGIGPGRYRVRGGLYDGWDDDTLPDDIDEEITFDGHSVVERVVEVKE